MGTFRENSGLGELAGTIGGMVFVNYKPGLKIIRRRPERKKPAREAEIANRKDFAQAVTYAKGVWAEQPALRARYNAAARLQGRRGFDLAKADFRLRPEIREVNLSGYSGKPGEPIVIDATDDFEVKAVTVVVQQLNGTALEEGAAVAKDGQWVYNAQTEVAAGQTVVVQVTAADNPGHKTTRSFDHACGPRG